MIHLITFINLFLAGNRLPVFLFVDGFAVFSFFLSVQYIIEKFTMDKHSRFTPLELLILFFVMLSVISFVFFFQKDNPASISAYMYGIHLLLLPVFLFFVVKKLDIEEKKTVIRVVIYLNLFLVSVGLLLYLLQPDFYTQFLRENFAQQGYDAVWQIYGRMQSYLGSTAVGNIAAVSIILMCIDEMRSRLRTIYLSLLIIAGLLAQQRSGITITLIAFTYYAFTIRSEKLRSKLVALAILVVLTGVLFVTFEYRYQGLKADTIITHIYTKMVDEFIFGNPLQEREEGYIKGWKLLFEYPLGLGLGATTSAADSYGANPGGQIVDANFLRILGDLGLAGLLAFMSIIYFAIWKSMIIEKTSAWILLLLFYCFQALGTNIFDSLYVSHSFWLYLGLMDSWNVKSMQSG
jgi:hypothetical protein